MAPIPQTIKSIALATGRENFHVDYCVAKLGIKPTALIGATRIFSDADADRIRAELAKTPGARTLSAVAV